MSTDHVSPYVHGSYGVRRRGPEDAPTLADQHQLRSLLDIVHTREQQDPLDMTEDLLRMIGAWHPGDGVCYRLRQLRRIRDAFWGLARYQPGDRVRLTSGYRVPTHLDPYRDVLVPGNPATVESIAWENDAFRWAVSMDAERQKVKDGKRTHFHTYRMRETDIEPLVTHVPSVP